MLNRALINGGDGDGDHDAVDSLHHHYRQDTNGDGDQDDDASSNKAIACTRRRVCIISCVAVILSIAMGMVGGLWYHHHYSMSGDDDSIRPVPPPPPLSCIDVNMLRFWFEEKPLKVLYYNHSSLSNATLFPRVTNISWGAFNDPDMQALLVKQAVWVIDQLIGACRPLEYTLVWQEERSDMLVQLRDIYLRKLEYVHAHESSSKYMLTGLIPKWYHGFLDQREMIHSIGGGILLGDGQRFEHTWYETVPNHEYGPIQIGMGGDIEIEREIGVLRRFGTDAARWYLSFPGGMNMTNPANGRARIPTIVTVDDEYRTLVTNAIRASGNLTEAVKQQMIDAIKPTALAQVEAQVIRFARAYSPDRGTLMYEGGVEVLYDTVATQSSSSSSGPLRWREPEAFPTDATMILPCVNESRPTLRSLAALVSKFRHGDILRNHMQFGMVLRDSGSGSGDSGSDGNNTDASAAPAVYFSNMMVDEVDRRNPSIFDAIAIRSLYVRRVTYDDKTSSNTTHISALNLLGWLNWTFRTSYTQMWGRAPGHESISVSAPVDPHVLVANGGVHYSDYNANVTQLSSKCVVVTGEYDYCTGYN